MTENIQRFLASRRIENDPIIVHWMRSSGMQEALTIIDKRVEYLLNHKAMKKLNQWFLADDSNFNDITAERYVINYLMKQNTNISDNLYKSGTDAYLKHASSCVGVEVTTLNGFFGEWILYERLPHILKDHGFLSDKNLEINYSQQRILKEARKSKRKIYEYIQQCAMFIMSKNYDSLRTLEISVAQDNRCIGHIH